MKENRNLASVERKVNVKSNDWLTIENELL